MTGPGRRVVTAALDERGVAEAVAESEKRLGETGRVLLRPSGTEPVVRVMVEATTADDAKRHADAHGSRAR